MTAVATIHALHPDPVRIAGYVEAVTADRVLGWAWSPARPGLRAAVELRLGDTTVAEIQADKPREDLERSGIGDGRHAFELTIPPEFRARAADLTVHARAGDEPAVRIGAPPAGDTLDDRVAKLTRGVEMLLNAQRHIHRDIQDAVVRRTEGSGDITGLANIQAATAEQIAAVEQFVIRLDAHLAKMAEQPGGGTRVSRASSWALGISGLALAVSIAGLIHTLAG